MTRVLYLDVFFLINAVMDFLLLKLTQSVLSLPGRGRWWFPAVGAAFGAAWSCAEVLLPGLPIWAEVLINGGLVTGIMVWLSFGYRSGHGFLRSMAGFWIVSVAAGGICGAVAEHSSGVWYLAGIRVSRQWSLAEFMLTAAGIYLTGRWCAARLRRWLRNKEQLFEVTLYYRGKKKTVSALLDTGNQLREPYGGNPVHVVSYDACRDLCETASRVIYIPFSAVGTRNGLLPGIQLDGMDVCRDGCVVSHYTKPWIAISREPLSPRHQYEMLLHGE